MRPSAGTGKRNFRIPVLEILRRTVPGDSDLFELAGRRANRWITRTDMRRGPVRENAAPLLRRAAEAPILQAMEIIGTGKTATVYRFDEGKALKLFNAEYGRPAVEYEMRLAQVAAAYCSSAPKCYGLVKDGDREGLLYEYLPGETLIARLLRNPWSTDRIARILAEEQNRIHQCVAGTLPNEKIRFAKQIDRSAAYLGPIRDEILERLDGLSTESRLCHGDFHPGNIIVGKDGPRVIDWMNGYAGTPLGDVARTYLMIVTPYLPDGLPGYLSPLVWSLKTRLAGRYLAEYRRQSHIDTGGVYAWFAVAAAVRLCDEIDEERKWLLDIIDKSLSGVRFLPSGRSARRAYVSAAKS
jgi:aminoglycoside phosphotransferase (APT) family kinase protein